LRPGWSNVLRLSALLVGAALARFAAAAAPPPPAIPTGAELEAAGAVIGKITLVPGDIFDPSIPGEDSWPYRTADKLHISTRPSVIRRQLLFESGDPYRLRLIQETERILRTNAYLYDAKVVPVAWDGCTVDLEVRTRDNWALNPGFNYNRKGGENNASVQIEEKNLVGTGRQLLFNWAQDVDRESLTFGFYDPHFLSDWTRLALTYADADDGDTRILRYDRPF